VDTSASRHSKTPDPGCLSGQVPGERHFAFERR
jgi:hypothetical protein